jgi:nucleotidyltransferase/DNA polymerase involved in DNA repair
VLWLSLYFSNLPIELRGPEDAIPLAVTDRLHSRRIVIAANTAARAAGIHVGLDATTSLVREPALKLLERTPAEERRALKGLATWAIQFSADIALDEARWITISTGSTHCSHASMRGFRHWDIRGGIRDRGDDASGLCGRPSCLGAHRAETR